MKLVKNNYLIIIIICLSIVLICSKSSDNTTLDEVKLKDVDTNKGMYAIMIQQEGENYIPYEQETWPESGYTFNSEKSGCLDSDGKKLTNTKLDFMDGKIKLETNSTGYCYIYFDKEEPMNLRKACEKQSDMQNCITNNSTELSKIENLKNSNKGDLQYRYVGTQEDDTNGNIKNYVCFGSDNCNKNATNDHLYRIIGITLDGRIKIQKNNSIGTAAWDSRYTSDIKWESSEMYTNTLNSFYSNTNYVSSTMKNKIEYHTWNTGDVNISELPTGDIVYNLEDDIKTHKGYYGLAYLSDYYFAYNEGGTQDCANSSPYCLSWMTPSNYSTLWSNKTVEWTMSRYGHYGISHYRAWYMGYYGIVSTTYLYDTPAVRPVFYLKDDVVISSGIGTLGDPYIIN